jgi:hypothetical protein
VVSVEVTEVTEMTSANAVEDDAPPEEVGCSQRLPPASHKWGRAWRIDERWAKRLDRG